MAALRGRAQPAIGSAAWIQDENAQVDLFCGQEAEDFAFSARNEVEWLNEHMVEIFSKEQMNVADIFKTPGKLRGKTPRTARKRNPLESREPLSDIFSTNTQPVPLTASRLSPVKYSSPAKIATFQVAEDHPVNRTEKEQDQHQQHKQQQTLSNADSGYHGLPEDDMDLDNTVESANTHDTLDDFPHSPSAKKASTEGSSTDRSMTDRSFHSAREDLTKRDVIAETTMQNPTSVSGPDRTESGQNHSERDVVMLDQPQIEGADEFADESRSSSQESSPAHGLVRKSSLTFATLPAREPITTKKSIGNRTSRTSHLDQLKSGTMQGSSLLHRLTGGKSIGGVRPPHRDDEEEKEEEAAGLSVTRPAMTRDESDSDSRMTKLHNKSSTQRLHDRINQLSKSQPPRPTKSIPANTSAQPIYPDLIKQAQQREESEQPSTDTGSSLRHDDDDSWINSPKSKAVTQERPLLSKNSSADILPKHSAQQVLPDHRNVEAHRIEDRIVQISQDQRKTETTQPSLPHEVKGHAAAADGHSTTPVGSPSVRRPVDGPLSASKLRLQSIMKTAKGLFSSSASASAQAKMEVMSPSTGVQTTNAGLHPEKDFDASDSSSETEQRPHLESPGPQKGRAPEHAEARKTRSSTEKEARDRAKEVASREQIDREREIVRQQELAIQANNRTKEASKDLARPTRQSPRKTQTQAQEQEKTLQIETSRSATQLPSEQGRQSQAHKYKDVRRPNKPAKDAVSQSKAPPVNIRIGMPSRRVPLNNSTISAGLQDTLQPPQGKQLGVTKKASNASISSTGLSNGPKSSIHTQKPRALIAAERKKEQDDREAQRKLDQKREIEKRRLAQQEEARRQEQSQRQEAEKQRERERTVAAEDAKKLAQKQAIEKRRLEMQKKEQRAASRADGNVNHHAVGSTSRPELGGNRPPSRQAHQPEHHRPTTSHAANPSRAPIKRVFDPDSEVAAPKTTKSQMGQNYQQHDSKRRRTNDDEPEEFPMRPTMAPPIRQSGIRKDGPKASIFGHSYTTAPPPAAHHAQQGSLLKSTTTSQVYQQHLYSNQQPRQGYQPDTSKYRDGNRIPFAENPNPPTHQQQQQQPSAQPFKTPLPSKIAHPSRQSPHYTNGENIQLADIPTDSEDDDSSPDTAQKRQRAASLPDWVQSPYLNNILRNQEEHMDADAVFGPVGSPHLEEMFKERAHKFRSRTSSANWSGQDRLTQEEVRKDVEARARIRREGGWTFSGST